MDTQTVVEPVVTFVAAPRWLAEPYKGIGYAVYDLAQGKDLVCVCVYKKGARNVIDLLDTLQEQIDRLEALDKRS